jgi:hypothetical protein
MSIILFIPPLPTPLHHVRMEKDEGGLVVMVGGDGDLFVNVSIHR